MTFKNPYSGEIRGSITSLTNVFRHLKLYSMAYFPSKNQSESDNAFAPKSTFIQLASYDAKNETMTLTFKNGSQYRYNDVGKSTWESFKSSPDSGVYYSRLIRGRLTSVPVKKTDVGQPKSTPLKKLKIERGLTNGKRSLWKRGNRRTLRRAGLDGPGTVPSSLYTD